MVVKERSKKATHGIQTRQWHHSASHRVWNEFARIVNLSCFSSFIRFFFHNVNVSAYNNGVKKKNFFVQIRSHVAISFLSLILSNFVYIRIQPIVETMFVLDIARSKQTRLQFCRAFQEKKIVRTWCLSQELRMDLFLKNLGYFDDFHSKWHNEWRE